MKRCLRPESMNERAMVNKDAHLHRPHGSLAADATEPAWNGYLLTVA